MFPDKPALTRRDLLAAAAVLLFSFCYMFFCNSKPITSINGDQLVYNQLAVNMLEGRGFSQCVTPPFTPSIVRTPAYPAFLAAVYVVSGRENFEAVRAVQVLLMTLSALFIFMTALSVTGSKAAAFLSLVLFSCCGFDYYTGRGIYGYLFTEPLVIFLTSVSVFLLVEIIRGQKLANCILLGLASGLAMLTRPSNILFPAVAAVFMLCTAFSARMARLAAAMLLSCALMVVPWTLRNYAAFSDFIPLSVSLQGNFLYCEMAYNPDYIANRYMKGDAPEVTLSPEQRAEADKALAGLYGQFLYGGPGGMEIFVHDAVLKRIGVGLIKENKAVFVKRWFYRALSHWSVSDLSLLFSPGRLPGGQAMKLAVKSAAILLALYGLAGNWRQPLFIALLLFPVYNTLMYTLLTPEYRYSTPARGMIFILLAAGICRLAGQLRVIYGRFYRGGS